MKHAKLRLGVVVNDAPLPSNIVDFIRQSQQAEFYRVESLIVKQNSPTTFGFNLHLIENKLFIFIKKIEQKLLPNTSRFKSFFKPYSPSQLKDEFNIDPYTVSSRSNQNALESLKQKNLDLIFLAEDITFDEAFLFEEILSASKQGIVYIDYYANSSSAKNLPAGFWSMLKQSPSSSFSIKTIAQSNLCQTLLEGKVYTAYFYLMNVINLMQRSHRHLHLVLEKMGKNQQENLEQAQKEKSVNETNPHFFLTPQAPSITQQIRYVAQTALHLCKKKWWKLQKKTMRWGVAYQFTEDWQQADLTKSIMVKNPPNHFLADPFIIQKNGVHYCYVEDYDYASKKGKLTVYQVNQDGFKSLGTALEEDFHLSYPFIFEVSGELFMCPETYQANDIRLYRCEEFPLHWKLHKVLKSNVSAADTNIFQWNEKWWMLTNIDSLGLDEHHAELHLFYADAFDATDWTPHPLNPIVFDPLRARNGGLLFKNNAIYRVFQQQGFDNYGEAMGIAKITALDTETYCEELLYNIPADFFKGLVGAHSYAFQQGLLVLDYKRLESTKN